MEAAKVEFLEVEGVPLIRVAGYFTKETGKEILPRAQELLRQGKIRQVVDLAGCKAINSPGVASLLDLLMLIHDDFKGLLVFCGLDKLKVNVFTMAGLLPLARATVTAEEGIAACREGSPPGQV